ncbi:MAG: ATP synthase subunit I [Halanaerobiales bacterium]
MMKTADPIQVQKEVVIKTLFVAAFPCFFAIIRGNFAVVKGLIFGLSISLLLFRLKAINIDKALNMSPGKAESFIRNRYFLNYIIYFLVLMVAQKQDGISFLAAAVGLILLKFTIIGLALIDQLKRSWQEKKDQFT